MKKIISIALAVMMIAALAALPVCATGLKQDSAKPTVTNLDFLDFSNVKDQYGVSNNQWAAYNSETQAWEAAKMPINNAYYTDDDETRYPYYYDIDNDEYYCYSAETKTFVKTSSDDFWEFYYSDPYAASLETEQANAKKFLAHIDWELVESGEVLRLVAKDSATNPGVAFLFDEYMAAIDTGSESGDNPRAEYCKIRIRNYSSSNNFTFGWMTNNLNGGTTFMQASVARLASTVEVASDSAEWKTYTFSLRDINANTNYGDSLQKDANGTPQSRWGAKLARLFIFPFGYNVTDGTGSYEGAKMDIDYIVIGSQDYVTNYKSALELDEESISSIEITKAPDKTSYYVGEEIDLTGLQLKATYKDGTVTTLDSCNSYYDFSIASDSTTVTLKYGEASAQYNVKVTGIDNIKIAALPESTTYEASAVASGFSATGVKIDITYADGTVKEGYVPSSKNISCSGLTVGEQIVTVNYFGAKATFAISIINVTGITVKPLEKNLYYGDELTLDDLDITCVYSDGSEKALADANINPTETLTYSTKTPGEVKIGVKLYNESLGIDVSAETTGKVMTPDSLEITKAPAKTEYEVDDKFVEDGMELNFVYGSKKVAVTDKEDYKVSYDFSQPAESATVTVTAGGLTATTTVKVNGTVVPPSTTAPSTTAKQGGDDGNGSPVVIIVIVVVAVLVVAGVVVFVVLKKKKK